jgi:DNA-binding HxlR family transcriptional regulator
LQGVSCLANTGLPIQQLKDLEADHVLARTDYNEVPQRVDYALTPLGRSLGST